MDLRFSPEEEAFRRDVRAFLEADLPAHIAAYQRDNFHVSGPIMREWHAILYARGWAAPAWPKHFGGQDWTPVQRYIFEEESCRAYAPKLPGFGIDMLGPVLHRFGTRQQQETYLPGILSGQTWWCQGYSEPGAGSDLAALKTRAIRDADHYILNGQKTWTSYGQLADKIFCLVRTSTQGKRQAGISFILVDLDSPGIEMRPIRLIDGGHDVNEVFFTDVRVPAENLVGEESQGWTIAKYLLGHERTNIASIGHALQLLSEARSVVRHTMRDGRRVIDNPLFAARLAQLEIELEATRITNLRMLFKAQTQGQPGPETSLLKIKSSVLRQELNDLSRRALGPAAAPFPSEDLVGNNALLPSSLAQKAARYFNERKISIYGGSTEIQRNILSKTLLEL